MLRYIPATSFLPLASRLSLNFYKVIVSESTQLMKVLKTSENILVRDLVDKNT